MVWIKNHIIVDCKSELPLCVDITPASIYDGTYAIPLIERYKNLYGYTLILIII